MSAAFRAQVRTPHVVVVGVDLSRSSERAVEWVAAHARTQDDWVLHFVHIIDDQRELNAQPRASSSTLHDAVLAFGEHFDAMGELQRRGRLRFRRLFADSPSEGIIAFAESTRADLVVVGESPRTLLDAFFPTTADRIARGAHCPVLIVRNPRNVLP